MVNFFKIIYHAFLVRSQFIPRFLFRDRFRVGLWFCVGSFSLSDEVERGRLFEEFGVGRRWEKGLGGRLKGKLFGFVGA